MKSKNEFFGEIYKLDSATDRYMIEIALDQYTDIFSEWDPAPFKRRSLDPDLELYLEASSEEIPLHYPIELYFTIPQGSQDDGMEEAAKNGLRNSCLFKLYLLRRKIEKTNTLMVRYIILGFMLLWIGTLLASQYADETILSLFADALLIGGWVFIWEAVSLFSFTNRELYHDYRTYKRLKNAPVIFQEIEKHSVVS